ncbi:hypothetical protein NMY22_g6188 [Coprinellus aureogranulatus]|nr:hypothetical protein NMY22_g6188 [Coprinellus aureogranulatus]
MPAHRTTTPAHRTPTPVDSNEQRIVRKSHSSPPSPPRRTLEEIKNDQEALLARPFHKRKPSDNKVKADLVKRGFDRLLLKEEKKPEQAEQLAVDNKAVLDQLASFVADFKRHGCFTLVPKQESDVLSMSPATSCA